MQQFIGFNISTNEYMIPILKVREIITMPSITALPHLPDYIKGVTNLRGAVIPIVNLKAFLDASGDDRTGKTVIVLTSGQVVFGIIVDGISGVIKVDEDKIEPPESFFNKNVDKIDGVAKIDDKLIVLLDTNKLLPLNDVSLLEDAVVNVKEAVDSDSVEVTKEISTIEGTVHVSEFYNSREFFGGKLDEHDPRQRVFEMMLQFMDALTTHDYERVKSITDDLLQESESELFTQVGKVTRRLHDSLEEFKNSVDHGLEKLTKDDVPNAIDKLEFVISKTEDAANKTMGIVESYFEESDEFSKHLKNIKNKKSLEYFTIFKESLDSNMTDIITAQQFQDITGQTIRKVIELVHRVEAELIRLITNFGMPLKAESEKVQDAAAMKDTETADTCIGNVEKVTQSDVESLLQEFGF